MALSSDQIKIRPGAEPFFFPGKTPHNRVGCLCLHGLSASPQEVYWLGKYLAEQGAMVYGARLYGHGIRPDFLWRVRWQDYYMGVLDGYHLLRQQCEQVVVLGLSMGGLLSLLLAANEPVAGVVPIAAPLDLQNTRLRQAHAMRYFTHTVARFDRDTDRINARIEERQRERGEPVTGRVAYYQHEAAGVAELLKLQTEVRRSLPRITAPALLVFSEKDQTVPFSNLDMIKNRLVGSKSVQELRLKESDHIVTNDVECDQVFEAAWAFVQQVTT